MPDEVNVADTPVAELARLALERAEGGLDEAARLLGAWARAHAGVRDELTAPLLPQACYQAVVAASWYERRVRWRPADDDRAPVTGDGAPAREKRSAY